MNPMKRSSYYSSMREEPESRVSIRLMERGPSGYGPVFRDRFDLFVFSRMFETDSEAIQQVMSGEGEKLFAFDRVLRTFVLGGFIRDSAGSPGLASWKRFYEKARASVAARADQYVEVTVRDLTLQGLLVSSGVAVASNAPHQADVTMSILCFSLTGGEVASYISGTDIRGHLSLESLQRLGLRGPDGASTSPAGFLTETQVQASRMTTPPITRFEV